MGHGKDIEQPFAANTVEPFIQLFHGSMARIIQARTPFGHSLKKD